MRHRVFAFKGKKEAAQKQIKKILKEKKMNRSASGDAIQFKTPGVSPVQGYFKTTENDGKVTHVEMYMSTAWWYFMITFLGFLMFAVLAYFFLESGDSFQGTLAIVVGVFQFAIMYLSSRILEKKWDVFISQEMHSNGFF